jgi:hypothetical protein
VLQFTIDPIAIQFVVAVWAEAAVAIAESPIAETIFFMPYPLFDRHKAVRLGSGS